VDAVIVGEGNGPMAPDTVNMGFIVYGTNPVAIDTVCSRLMGFDFRKIPSIRKAYDVQKFKLANFVPSDIEIVLKGNIFNINSIPEELIKKLKPHFGWKNHIEWNNE
jgi:uncharacterized protein (DUF362 family)